MVWIQLYQPPKAGARRGAKLRCCSVRYFIVFTYSVLSCPCPYGFTLYNVIYGTTLYTVLAYYGPSRAAPTNRVDFLFTALSTSFYGFNRGGGGTSFGVGPH